MTDDGGRVSDMARVRLTPRATSEHPELLEQDVRAFEPQPNDARMQVWKRTGRRGSGPQDGARTPPTPSVETELPACLVLVLRH